MTAPISNGPTTTRLHHYAGHYCRIKYGETVSQVHDSIEAEQRRQRDLERAGWKVIRVRWSDLKLIDEVVAQVLVAIRAKVGR